MTTECGSYTTESNYPMVAVVDGSAVSYRGAVWPRSTRPCVTDGCTPGDLDRHLDIGSDAVWIRGRPLMRGADRRALAEVRRGRGT